MNIEPEHNKEQVSLAPGFRAFNVIDNYSAQHYGTIAYRIAEDGKTCEFVSVIRNKNDKRNANIARKYLNERINTKDQKHYCVIDIEEIGTALNEHLPHYGNSDLKLLNEKSLTFNILSPAAIKSIGIRCVLEPVMHYKAREYRL